MQWNGRWFLLVYYCHWINGEGLTLMGGFISTILQCIVISHWFLQSPLSFIHWLTRDHWLLLLTSLSFLYFLLAKFFESIARGQWALMDASYFKPNKIETIWSRFAFLFLYFQHFFSCNCSTPLGIKRILFLLQQNRDSLVKVCYLCLFVFFACLFLYSVWTPLGIYFYFYWSKNRDSGSLENKFGSRWAKQPLQWLQALSAKDKSPPNEARNLERLSHSAKCTKMVIRETLLCKLEWKTV